MALSTKVSGTWREVNGVYVKVSGEWQEVSSIHTKVDGSWREIYANAIPIPEGLIVGYAGTIAPSGWSLFTSGQDRYLVGAGSTYTVGAAGGTDVNSGTLVTAGSHTGASTFWSSYTGGSYGASASGNHTHTYSFQSNPLRRRMVLIQADAGQTKLPANALVLSGAVTLSGLTQQYDNELSLLYLSDTTGTITATASATPTSSSSGAHTHYGGCSKSAVTPGEYQQEYNILTDQGAHTHTVTVTGISWSVKRRYLKAWTNASAAFNLAANMIGMWESITPPDGWSLCNGSNGTPDMRDYFVYFGPSANAGDASGDNTITWNYSTPQSAGHAHQGSGPTYSGDYAAQFAAHSDSHQMAGHSGSGNGSFLPPYYALAFIMYTG